MRDIVLAVCFFQISHHFIPPDIGDVIIAVIIYFAATSVLIRNLLDGTSRRVKTKGPLQQPRSLGGK